MMARCGVLAVMAVLLSGSAASAQAPSFSAAPTLQVQSEIKAASDAYARGDVAAAIRIWRPLAIAGDAVAQYNLGLCYKKGEGVPKDPKMAETWFEKAAEQGLEEARDAYGLQLFQNGNRLAAMPYIEESAGRGDPRAQYVYATALFNGDLVAKEWVRAYALMTRAAAAKNADGSDQIPPARGSLEQMDRLIPLDQRQRGLALARVFEDAAARRAPAPTIAARQPIRTEPMPPSRIGTTPDNPATAPSIPGAKPLSPRVPPKPPVAKPAPPKVTSVTPPPAAAPSGKWRVQLGAFSNAAGANALWGGLRKRIAALGPYQSYVVNAGAVTRLQAGPLASRAAADSLCASVKAAGQACIPVAP